jgi:hypothetical protein
MHSGIVAGLLRPIDLSMTENSSVESKTTNLEHAMVGEGTGSLRAAILCRLPYEVIAEKQGFQAN